MSSDENTSVDVSDKDSSLDSNVQESPKAPTVTSIRKLTIGLLDGGENSVWPDRYKVVINGDQRHLAVLDELGAVVQEYLDQN